MESTNPAYLLLMMYALTPTRWRTTLVPAVDGRLTFPDKRQQTPYPIGTTSVHTPILPTTYERRCLISTFLHWNFSVPQAAA